MSRSNDIAGLTTSILDGVTATEVGLGNVDNTSDANKPVSTAQQSAINLKANIASPTFTGTTTVADFVPATPLSHRNMIINGAMQIWQRGDGVSSTITVSDGVNEDYNSVDRWQPNFNGGCPGAFTINKSPDTPDGFASSQKIKCSSSGTPTSANQMSHWRYKIEAQDIAHLDYGSSSAKVITFSWYMKSVNYTSPLTILFIKGDNTTAYYLKSVTPTTSWARYSITIPANTNSGHGIDNDNGEGMIINIMLSGTSGGTYEQTGDSTAWGTSAKYYTNTQGNFFSSTSNELYLTGVQLELGSVATPFEHRSYGDELQKCQRYYQNSYRQDAEVVIGGSKKYPYEQPGSEDGVYQCSWSDGNIVGPTFITAMRTQPSMVFKSFGSNTSGKCTVTGTEQDCNATTYNHQHVSHLVIGGDHNNGAYVHCAWEANADL